MNNRSLHIKILTISFGAYLILVPVASLIATIYSKEIAEVVYALQETGKPDLVPVLPVIISVISAVTAMIVFMITLLLFAVKLLRLSVRDPLQNNLKIIRQTVDFLRGGFDGRD